MTNKDPLLDYLIKPFNNLIDNLIVNKKYNVCNIAVGITGQGKTYSITQNNISKLFNDTKVKLVIYSVPENAVLDKKAFAEAVEKLDNCKLVFKPNKALKYLRRGKNVVLCTSNQGMWTRASKYGLELLQYILTNLKDQVAIFIDEAHCWTISDILNYQDVSGNVPKNYEASLFKSVSKIAEISPFIFGITATPNREARGIIETIGTMKYEIYNNMAPKSLMIGKNAWLNKVNLFNTDSKSSIKSMILQMLLDMKKDEDLTGVKKTALIQVRANLSDKVIKKREEKGVSTWNANLTEMAQLIIEVNNEFKIFNTNEILYAIMNESEKTAYSTDKTVTETFDDDDEIKEELDDTDSSLKILLVVEKGKAGMNVYSLGYMMSVRQYNTKDYKADEYGYITETPLQILGRCVRLWTGQNNDKFVKENNGYDIISYLKNNINKLDIIKTLNSFNVYVTDNGVWGAAIQEFMDKYVTSLNDINFDALLNDLVEEEICPECNGTGIVGGTSKIIDFTKKDMKNIDKVFKIA